MAGLQVFTEVNDPALVHAFSHLRHTELRQLGFMVAGFAVFGLALLWLKFAPAV